MCPEARVAPVKSPQAPELHSRQDEKTHLFLSSSFMLYSTFSILIPLFIYFSIILPLSRSTFKKQTDALLHCS